jgi:hypothetical protein
VNDWMDQIYSQDYDEAKTMKKSAIEKIAKSSDLTNQLFLSAFCPIENIQKPIKPNLRVTSSSRSKGVLLPRCKSLVNFPLKKRHSNVKQEGTFYHLYRVCRF